MTAAHTATLIGCGDLGGRIGRRLAEQGVDVTAVRRRADRVPAPLRGLSADLTRDPLPDLAADLVVVCLTADDRDAAGYRRTYVEGMNRALEAITRSGRLPTRAVLVSSTGVYGEATGELDERTAPQPTRGTSSVLLEAEAAFRAALPRGTIARLSGLYGDREPRVVAQVRRGENPEPGRWTNRVHRDDAAAAVVHLLTRPEEPDGLYVVTDDEPSTIGALRRFVAGRLDLPWPPTDPTAAPVGRRLSNARLRATGFRFQYPTYREGYGAVLTGLA